jgi:hypothetical protein
VLRALPRASKISKTEDVVVQPCSDGAVLLDVATRCKGATMEAAGATESCSGERRFSFPVRMRTRRLADRLLAVASADIEAVEGHEVDLRPHDV